MDEISQQIKAIEAEIRQTPYHKGTEHHIGKLRARLARLKDKQVESNLKKAGGGGGGYALKKFGDATVVLIGPPSVGKSTLINQLTNTQSKVAEYAFTTLNVIPGMLFYHDAYIQIFDVPGLITGAGQGKGRGREVLSVARAADLLLIMCDPATFSHFDQILNELEGVGIRLNQTKPEILIEKKTQGGIIIHSNFRQDLGTDTIRAVIQEMGIKNGEVTLKAKVTLETLIDACSPNRVFLPALFVINKIDSAAPGQKFDNSFLTISAQKGIGLEALKEKIWEKLNLVRVFLVRPAEEPSSNHPVIVKKGQTLKEVALKIGSDFAEDKKAARLWGPTARFPGQEVSLSTPVAEGMQVRFI